MTPTTPSTAPYRMAARLFGIFFILAFISYGLGSGLVASVADGANGLADVFANKTMVVIGVILMAVVHSFVNIGLLVLAFPVLKLFNTFLAYGYFAAGLAATVTLIFGAIFLLMLLPLSDAFTAAGAGAEHFETIAAVLKGGGFFAYQIGMTIWGIGGLLFVYVLYVSNIVPRLLSVWGFAGYLVFIIGTISELFGSEIGVMLALPGGLFELSLSIWLIFKGFNLSKSSAV